MKYFLLGNSYDSKPFYKKPIFIIGAALVGVILLIIIIVAVSSSSSEPIEEEDNGENKSFIPNEKNVKFLGRSVMSKTSFSLVIQIVVPNSKSKPKDST